MPEPVFFKTANIKVYDKEIGIDTFLKEQDLSYNISIKGDDCNLLFFILTESPGLTISRFSEIPERNFGGYGINSL